MNDDEGRQLILPGQKIADQKLNLPNTHVEGEATYATVIGFLEEGRYIPLEARYRAYPEDVVVGIVMDSRHAGYEVDINLPYSAFVQSRDVRVQLEPGAVIMARIFRIGASDIDLTEVRKLPRGKVIDFPPAKVPRLIGKKSSMINMIKEQTGGEIIVGNNGYIWISESCDIPRVLKAVHVVVQKAHQSGLTDEIAALLQEGKP